MPVDQNYVRKCKVLFTENHKFIFFEERKPKKILPWCQTSRLIDRMVLRDEEVV